MNVSISSHKLAMEQQRLLYNNATSPILIAAGIAAFLCWYLRYSIEATVLFSWLYVLSLITFGRLWLVVLAKRSEKSGRHIKWLNRFFLGGIWLSAITWGAASFLLFPDTAPVHQTVFAIIIAGVSAGGIASLCSNWPAIAGFLTFVLLPLAARFLTGQDPNGPVLGGLVVLYWAVCLAGARKLHTNITENISLRLQSDENQKTIEHQARFDELTGLPNRHQLHRQLDRELSRAVRHKQSGALLLMDLDNFKMINSSLGHKAGDAVLQQVAQRLRRNLRREDITARMGGDEFAVLVPHLGISMELAAQKSQEIASKLTDFLMAPYVFDGQELNLTPSFGISLFPEQEKNADDILKQADTAMNQAKNAGRNTIRFFLPGMQQAADTRLRLLNDIKKAIANDEFSLHFQPQVKIDGTVVGGEGLLRWRHPTRGMIPPKEFISVAEETGIIVDIGNWVFTRICRVVKEWEDEQLLTASQTFAVNISAREFSSPAFVDRIIHTIEETGVNPQYLDIELTEGSLIASVSDTIKKIQTLREYGIKFSVDDFGTGYSSLSYLKSLPLNTLKIDRSFVNDVASTEQEVTLVEIIITMARSLNLKVVAEGVETIEELNYLASKGCHVYQGYYFCKPAPSEEFRKILQYGGVGTQHIPN